MTVTEPERYRSDLLVERIADALQFDHLSAALPGDVYPPYLLVGVTLFVEYGIFDLYNYVVSGQNSWLVQPNSLAIPALTVLAIVGLRYMHEAYAEAVVALGVPDQAADSDAHRRFEGLVSVRVRLGAYLATLVVYYSFLFFVMGLDTIVAISGWGLVLYAQLVTFPLVIVPTLVELALSYVAVHVVVPRRLAAADLGLFYYDPRNLGGFEPVGQLLKRSYYVYTGVLLLWFLQTHLPVILSGVIDSPYPAPGPIFQVALSGAWLLGVASIGYSMYRVHGIMKHQKDERIAELEAELKAAVEDPYDAHPDNIADREQYEEARETLDLVHGTRTYPTTFSMWSQIFLSVLLPQALNMAVSLPG